MINPRIALGGVNSGDSFAAMTAGTRLYANLPTGDRVGFTFQPESLTGSSGVETFKPVWIADDGVTWGLESFDRTLQEADGKYFVVGSGLPYVPAIADEGEEIFELVSPAGQRYGYRIVGETSSGADYRLATNHGSRQQHVAALHR